MRLISTWCCLIAAKPVGLAVAATVAFALLATTVLPVLNGGWYTHEEAASVALRAGGVAPAVEFFTLDLTNCIMGVGQPDISSGRRTPTPAQ